MTTGTLDIVRGQLAAQEAELRRRGVRHLAVFGSVARGKDRADSNVDIAVEIEEGHAFSLIRMEEARLLLEDAPRPPSGRRWRDCQFSTTGSGCVRA